MARGRRSITTRTPGSRNTSPGVSSEAGSGRVSRSSSAKGLSLVEPLPLSTRSRRRSTRTSLLSGEVSSVPTPDTSASASGHSTPATSAVPTPAPSILADEPSKASTLRKAGASIEVRLPQKKMLPEDGERRLRRSEYSLNPLPKRKRDEIGDSEDDELSDNSPDAVVARRLQDEEYRKASVPLSSSFSRSGLRSKHHLSPSLSLRPAGAKEDDTHEITGLSKRFAPVAKHNRSAEEIGADETTGFSKGFARSVKNTRLAKRARTILDSDDDEDDLDESDFELDDWLSEMNHGGSNKLKKSSLGKGPPKRKSSAPKATRSSFQVPPADESDEGSDFLSLNDSFSDAESVESALSESSSATNAVRAIARQRRGFQRTGGKRLKKERNRLETHHPEILTMWTDLENMPTLKAGKAEQPKSISRQLKPFQLEGLAWMMAMEKIKWKGGLLGDEMGLGKTIQAVSLIMSDFPAKKPSLVLVPPVALMQWVSEIESYTDGTLKTFVFHGTNNKTKNMTVKELKKYDVILMSYNSLESMYRKQEKGFKRKNGIYKEESLIHSIVFHRTILDEAHSIKTRTTMTAKACFALQTEYRWCLTGTPLQNRIGEFFSLIRFLDVRPFANYLCKQCPCSTPEWTMNEDSRCSQCNHAGMQHVSVFNQELLNPIQKWGSVGPGAEAFRKLRLMTDRIMLRRLKKDHTNSMELPVKEIYVDRQFFGEEENDFANSIMTNGQRNFDTYVAQGVLLNNYANIFGLIMQMRQVADHPDLILKKNAEGGQNVLVCCICDEPAEDTIRSRCKHDFCRLCARSYLRSSAEPDCPQCHIPLSIDLDQPEIEQDETLVKKTSIINRIKMENWTSSSKIELLVHELHRLRSDNASHKSIIFSQFTTMLQLIEWRLRRAGITTVMLDGTMTPAQRQASIDHFMKNVDVECFLVSLKAGGVALNLTEASRVFIVDPWWNPAAEWQSADRCHRIGQTRPCIITRLCIEDSVESRMVLIQEKKTNMIHSTVNADDKAMESLSPEDMQFLFRGT